MLRVAQWHTAVAQLWVFTQCSVWAQRGSERFPAPGGDILQCNNYESKIDLLKYIKLSRNFPFLSTFCSIEFNSSTFSADYPPLLPVPFSWDQWGELGSASALGYWALSPWQYPGETGHQWSPVISIYQNLKQLPQWVIYGFTNKSERLYHWIHFGLWYNLTVEVIITFTFHPPKLREPPMSQMKIVLTAASYLEKEVILASLWEKWENWSREKRFLVQCCETSYESYSWAWVR